MKSVVKFLVLVVILTVGFTQNLLGQKVINNNNVETGVQYLSGTGHDDAVNWEFYCTEGNNSGKWTTIGVPSCWELQGFGTYQYGMPFYGKENPAGIAKEEGKYKYKFKLPKEWEGRTIRIVFDGVMTDCSADINGRRCIKRHQGAFYTFKCDVSDRIFFGDKENVLEVTVKKESENSSVNMAERRGDYWNFGGIFRPVFVEALPVFNIDRTAIDAKADGNFYADVFFGVAMSSTAKITAQLSDLNGKNIGKPIEVSVNNGSDKVVVRGKFDNIKTWTPETPNLYYVNFTLSDKGETKHIVRERIGFRTIEVRESDGIYINGQRILVKGVNRHSFRPETGRTLSRKDNYDDVRLIKSMNMNAVRLSHYPSDRAFLEACDELGLYVMVELGGWHNSYDSNVGKKLVYEMVTRDVNHPSVTWWASGNEGGHNFELDKEYAPLDPQKRPLLHPQKNFGGFETMHYRSYGESQEYMRLPEIFMPTEFLHGLYDGGIGAGLWDYWEMMRNHPRCAGGFLWVFADEGVKRVDQGGRIDNVGNYGADGIVGPHHEKEGSYYTVKQVWSPVQIMNDELSESFDGTFIVENRYDFTNLKECSFKWTLKSFKDGKESVVKAGDVKGVDLKPHTSGTLKVSLPSDWRKADVLYLTAYNPNGDELWAWNWEWKQPSEYKQFTTKSTKLSVKEDNDYLLVRNGDTQLLFDKKTGYLKSVNQEEKSIAFGDGPRFIAARRGDRSKDVFYNHDDKEARSKERIYDDVSGVNKLRNFTYNEAGDSIIVEADYFGSLAKTKWVISTNGDIRLDYKYQYYGTVELMGIMFDYPEENVLSKRWLGEGPYRVWQNRIHGTNFGIWENDYNDPVPGETFTYPEFKGYFNNWKWLSLDTKQGKINISNAGSGQYLGVYTPRDGRDVLLYTIPQSGIAVLNVIPAVRNKVNTTDLVGPSSQAQWSKGIYEGSIYLNFEAR